ncbi:unnamed protein product [Rhizoctonia solani]|uniref:Cytochrome P450 n=1 Tax=Rhizoctonia solani TaxID=456999 RepID=A0A8H2XJ75_9AGAM|nr:unnamed protein product [Rhizoctonia solani]
MRSYGLTYKIKGALFHPDIIVTGDHDILADIFGKGVYSYRRGLVWAEGSVHKRQRQELAPFFTTRATRDTFNTINACALKGAENLELHITKSLVNPKQGTVDTLEWTSSITLDIIGRFAFDYDFQSGQSPAAQVLKDSWKKQTKAGLHWTALFGQVTTRAFPFITDILFPFLGAQLAVRKKLREISQSIIDGDVGEGKEKDVLTTLVRLLREGEIISTQDELLDHMCTIVLAGQETASGSLGFALHLLAKNPKYQTRLREEITQLGREPTYDDLTSGMPWLDAVMKESFRRRPLVPHLERVTTKDCLLKLRVPVKASDGTQITEIPIKAGQVIHIPTIALNHAKSVWGEDADEFKPERWLDPTRLEHVSKNFGWNGMLVFSDGPRLCIGYRLAVLSFKVSTLMILGRMQYLSVIQFETILATYIRKFEFHDTGAIINGRFSGTMQSYVANEEDKGTQLPLSISLVDELRSR